MLTADAAVCALLLRVLRSTTQLDSFRLVRDATNGRNAWFALVESCGHALAGVHARRALKLQIAALQWRGFPSGARYTAEAQRLSLLIGSNANALADLRLAVVDGIAPHNGNDARLGADGGIGGQRHCRGSWAPVFTVITVKILLRTYLQCKVKVIFLEALKRGAMGLSASGRLRRVAPAN